MADDDNAARIIRLIPSGVNMKFPSSAVVNLTRVDPVPSPHRRTDKKLFFCYLSSLPSRLRSRQAGAKTRRELFASVLIAAKTSSMKSAPKVEAKKKAFFDQNKVN
jgi:hypothetical protein